MKLGLIKSAWVQTGRVTAFGDWSVDWVIEAHAKTAALPRAAVGLWP
jgi:hypothetical protein